MELGGEKNLMSYKQSIIDAMGWLGEQPDTIFIGQTVAVPGSYMYGSLEKVPTEKRVELPVAEEMQMGMTLGLALQGFCVVSIYPRIDFMVLALNQLVNHIDKLPEMSEGRMKTRIIVRTSVGPKQPLDGGPQHTNDYLSAIRNMCKNVWAQRIPPATSDTIMMLYQSAYRNGYDAPATVCVEDGSLY